MKKIIFLLTFLLIILPESVFAYTMPQPTSMACFDDGTCLTRENTTLSSYSGQDFYFSPYRMGGVSSSEYIKNLDFRFNSANLCTGKDLSISGTIASIYNFFYYQNSTIKVYNNNQELTCSFSPADPYHNMNFYCYGQGGGDFIVTIQQNTYSRVEQYQIGISKEMTVSCDVSNEAVVNQSIINTQNIINNQNSNTQSIIEDNQQNTQDIIDNQNQNTQEQIESQRVCTYFDKSNIFIDNSFLNSYGTVSSNSNYGITDYISVKNSNIIIKNKYTYSDGTYWCFYNINKSLISCQAMFNVEQITIPNNTSYFRSSIRKDLNRPTFEVCTNGNQALNDSLNGLNDTLNDTSQPNTNQDIQDMDNMVASDTPISDLITMPLTLINAYINGVNSSCSSINLGNLYGTNLILPCIDLEQRLGSNLWNIIDALFSLFMCYNIGMLFISAFDGITSLRDDFEGLYQPRHADTGYQPKHGG